MNFEANLLIYVELFLSIAYTEDMMFLKNPLSEFLGGKAYDLFLFKHIKIILCIFLWGFQLLKSISSLKTIM